MVVSTLPLLYVGRSGSALFRKNGVHTKHIVFKYGGIGLHTCTHPWTASSEKNTLETRHPLLHEDEIPARHHSLHTEPFFALSIDVLLSG